MLTDLRHLLNPQKCQRVSVLLCPSLCLGLQMGAKGQGKCGKLAIEMAKGPKQWANGGKKGPNKSLHLNCPLNLQC